jgi:hypothetical protein
VLAGQRAEQGRLRRADADQPVFATHARDGDGATR